MVNILLSQYNFHEKWAREIILKYMNFNNKIVVIPFSFHEKWISNNQEWQNAYNAEYGKYYKEIVKPFIDLSICEENITWINYFEDTQDKMKRVIESSDIVFLTGGLPDMAVKRVLEKDLLNSINKSKLIIGASAGALIQLNNYYLSPDEDYPEFMYSDGLGLIKKDFQIEVHYDETDIQNRCIQKVLKEKTDTVYAIKDTGGIILDNDKITLLGDVVTFKR
ncbi:Type 1 glutamine amidotransferase-like domain-containing protein [Oceanirhabdus sp. W0125-5]|uniref:Type 1 glutamine amidotransferase-like domain-containing protein n=1 Tax=Oceanirhabdus sp. W0125-5 TaxID=2999116 RepID=UPI0022F33CBC|nr:Type 1 glutamine amidotransferase-like domain-containing protein [Oceanirhabdus sp. W0125-5]WBW96395.1 Type 1 glutamine amidotransferase-like domain-containing protein [Oceanirhabdus sp. W0125-5]